MHCRTVGCKLVFHCLHRSWTHVHSPWTAASSCASMWGGGGIFCDLRQFLLHDGKDDEASFGDAVNRYFQSSLVTCVSHQLCLSKKLYVFVLKSKEGSTTMF